MQKIELTAYDMAQRFVGIKEIPGTENTSQILVMLRLDSNGPKTTR